jgi:hypothetical protein
MRTVLALAALAAIAAAILLSAEPSRRPSRPQPRQPPTASASPTAIATRTPAPPRLDRTAINRQDRTGARHRDREAEVVDTRPLLSRLPLTRAAVRLDIAGLSPDDRSTVLVIDPGARARAHARAVYQAELARAGDSGDAYVLEWAR